MKLIKALIVFRYLLHSRQWFVVAEDKNGLSHLIDGNINIGQLMVVVNKEIEEAVGMNDALESAKNILTNKQ